MNLSRTKRRSAEEGSGWEGFFANDSDQRALSRSASESDSAGEARTGFKVLVVDDERLLADTTSSILRTAGFHTKTAYDGWAALEIARTFGPDCILTDVMMPMMNGVELAIAITKMFPGTKVVLFSGQAGWECESQATTCGSVMTSLAA